MGAICLDIRSRAIGHQLAYIGTLTRTAVEPRGILTRRMADAGEIVGVRVLDHIVVGEAFVSLRRRGGW